VFGDRGMPQYHRKWQRTTRETLRWPLAVICRSLGHEPADATMFYARLSLDPVRQSVTSAISAMLTGGREESLRGDTDQSHPSETQASRLASIALSATKNHEGIQGADIST